LKDNVVIQLLTGKDCEISDNGKSIDEFEPGTCSILMAVLCTEPLHPGMSRGRGNLTFLFSTDEAKGWTETIYQNLRLRLADAASARDTSTVRYEAIDYLKRTCLIESRPTGAHGLWEELQRMAEMYQQRIHSSSNPRNKLTVPSIKNASPAPDVLSSTVDSGSCLTPDT
jgi:hypothetical protein